MRLKTGNIKNILKNSIFKNFSWMFMPQLVSMIGSLLVSIFAARLFGAEEYGAYNYAVAFVAIISPLYLWGIESYAIKEFAQQKDDIDTTYGTIFYGLLLLAMIVTFAVDILVGVTRLSLNKRLYIWILLAPYFLNSLITAKFYLVGVRKIKLLSIYQVFLQLLFLLAKIYVIVIIRSVLIFVVTCSAENFLQFIVYFLVLKIEKIEIRKTFSKVKLYRIFKICSPLLLSSFAVNVYMKADQLMVGSMLGDSELGIYSIAVKCSEFWYIIPATIYTVFLPVLSNSMYYDKSEFWDKLQKFADILGAISYFAIILLVFFGTQIILMAYGKEYYKAGSIAKAYIFGGLPVGIGYALSAYVSIHEQSWFSFINTLFGCILNLLLNYLLIPKYGVYGAVIATVVVCFSGAFILCFFCGIFNKDYRKVLLCQIKALFPFYRLLRYIL